MQAVKQTPASSTRLGYGRRPPRNRNISTPSARTTRPTAATARSCAPAGLVAWIIDKYRDWSDCGGDLETRWDKDTILTVATLYWATGTIGSSFGQYYSYPLNEPVPPITVPASSP
jgi:hypothetical protein